MSSKVKRKVIVETSKEGGDQPRRPSVFERLGKGTTVNVVASQPQERQSRGDQNEKCRNWLRTGSCAYGNTCRYQHDSFQNSSRHVAKQTEKDMEEKDLRHKVRPKRTETKESRTGSVSPKRKNSKRSTSRSRKGEHESKIKSTVVVTRPRSPAPPAPTEHNEAEKKPDGSWEDDSDDWPLDAAQLDYKEELTLERKRQQLQRELELELKKERQMNVSGSESSSSSSSSESGSRSSSSGSTSSSSEEDSDGSSSSTSTSSSSGSQAPTKKRTNKIPPESKELSKKTKLSKKLETKHRDNNEKPKSSRLTMKDRSATPVLDAKGSKRSRDRWSRTTPSPRRRGKQQLDAKGKGRGPRTPSPVHQGRNQRQWGQSSSTDSRSDLLRTRGKRHKRKRDVLRRNDRLKSGPIPNPPPLSSPNRTALLPMPPKKSKQRREERDRNRRMGLNSSPALLSRVAGSTNTQPPSLLGYAQPYSLDQGDKPGGKQSQSTDRSRTHLKKEAGDLSLRLKLNESRDKSRRRLSPQRDVKGSLSPYKDRFESDTHFSAQKKPFSQVSHVEKDSKGDRRRSPMSPPRVGNDARDRKKASNDVEKRRDGREHSPRDFPSHRDGPYHGSDGHMFDKRCTESKAKRASSPESKKIRDDRNRDRGIKDRVSDYDNSVMWNDNHRKLNTAPSGRRTPDPPHNRAEPRSQPQSAPSHRDRSREADQDRKKRKEREVSGREDTERQRITSPRRSQSPVHGHHTSRKNESLSGSRARMFESDIPPGEREYAYGYDSLRDSYMDRLLPPDYEQDVIRGPSMYSSEVYPESRYRRDASLKEGAPPIMDRYGNRDVVSPRDVLPHRDAIGTDGRNEDYISDLSMDERRSFDERWSRGRSGRDDWDLYGSVPAAPLPPHVAAALDEDRYGMPRRRRASPDWPRGRTEAAPGHRQPGRGQGGPPPTKEPKSRSPNDRAKSGANRSWGDLGSRPDSGRGVEGKHEDLQKSQDERKVRNVRKERPKRKEDPISDKPFLAKEKGIKRMHSSSPVPKDAKRRKEEPQTIDSGSVVEKGVSSKRNREESRGIEPKAVSRNQKSTKSDAASPKSDMSHTSRISGQEKTDSSYKTLTNAKAKFDKEDRKLRRNAEKPAQADDFSDWSDDDDELLNRDDFPEQTEVSHEVRGDVAPGSKHKAKEEPRSKGKERGKTSSKERVHDDVPHSNKDRSQEAKELEVQETYILKEEAATDLDEYMTAESVDYDPISDEDLDALIEEPDDCLLRPAQEEEKSKIVDALDVDWSTLMAARKPAFVAGSARRRFAPARLLSRVGFSRAFAGAELTERLAQACQQQLDEEGEGAEPFSMEHPVAAFHVAIAQNKLERRAAFDNIGPFRRALCARRDLHIRKLLCKPVNKLNACVPVVYSPQYSVVDKDLYKQSLELLKQKKIEAPPQAINVC